MDNPVSLSQWMKFDVNMGVGIRTGTLVITAEIQAR